MVGFGSVASWGGISSEMARVAPGDHICVPFVNNETLLDSLTFYVAGGLARNERVVVVGMPALKRSILQKLRAIGVRKTLLPHQLIWVAQDELYGGPAARSPEAMWNDLRQHSRRARSDGFSGLRATGAPPVVPDSEPLLAYESGLDEVAKQEGATLFCVYCKPQTSPRLMRALLNVHSHVWLQDRYFQNIDCAPGDNGQAPCLTDEQHLNWSLNRLFRSRDHEATAGHADNATLADLKRLAFALVRGMDHRDRLLGMLARQLRAVSAQLATVGALPETDEAKEAYERLAHLADRLDAIAALVSEPAEAAPCTLDLAALLEKLIRKLSPHFAQGAGPVTFHGEERVIGRFDQEHICETFEHLIRLALRHACDGPVDINVERQGPSARVTIRYQGLDGAGAAAALSGRLPHQHELYDCLGIELFFARERLRRIDGTLTVASWADDTMLLSIDLPRNMLSSFASV